MCLRAPTGPGSTYVSLANCILNLGDSVFERDWAWLGVNERE